MCNSKFYSALVAPQQARKVQEHGLLVERWGQDLQRRTDHLAQTTGQFVEERGKFIQQKAQESLLYTQLLQIPNSCSKDLYGQAIQTQTDARTAYIQALTAYIAVLQTTLKKIESSFN